MNPNCFEPGRPRARAFAQTAALALTLAAPWAQAARPLATDDAGVLAEGDCEWESVLLHARAPGGPAERGLANQLACGVNGSTQLSIAHVAVKSDDAHAQSLVLGGKTELLDPASRVLAVTLFYGASFDRSGGDGYRPAARSLGVIGTSEPVDGWTTHVNLGWARDVAAKDNGLTWNLALEHSLTDRLDAGVEWLGAERCRPSWGAGLRYTLPEHWSFNLGLLAETGASGPRLWSAGLKFAF